MEYTRTWPTPLLPENAYFIRDESWILERSVGIYPSDRDHFWWVEFDNGLGVRESKTPVGTHDLKFLLQQCELNWGDVLWAFEPSRRYVTPPWATEMFPPDVLRGARRQVRSVGSSKSDLGHVYFLQGESGGPIKIGTSRNIKGRLRTHQSSNPTALRVLATIKGGRETESDIHRMFAKYQVKREWFEPSPEILAYINECRRGRRDYDS